MIETAWRPFEPSREAVVAAHDERDRLKCPRQVFIDDGFPPGQCQRLAGHTGLCDAYDGRDDADRKAKPYPGKGVFDFTGERVL